MEKIRVNYTGWVEVDKNDINVVNTEDNSPIDVTNMSADEIASKLNDGSAILKSFGETHSSAVDGEDDWDFEAVED